jgi:hypothetical protein
MKKYNETEQQHSLRIKWQRYASAFLVKMQWYGFVIPAPLHKCVDCGRQADDWEHRDYSKPLEVEAVCHGCNLSRGRAFVPDYNPPASPAKSEDWNSPAFAAVRANPIDVPVCEPAALMRAKATKGRRTRFEKDLIKSAKMRDKVRTLYAGGMKQISIARKLDITPPRVWQILYPTAASTKRLAKQVGKNEIELPEKP